jgi:hypothetical protein
MTDQTVAASANGAMDEPDPLEPTQAEIDAWVTRERARRQEWLNGPSDEERQAYASRLRHRRVSDAFDEGENRIREGMHTGVRVGREGQLAVEGAMTLLYRWSRRTMAELVRAGREWEEETSLPNRRRRVPLDDEES